MAPEKSGNLSNIFFRINESQGNTIDMVRSKVEDGNILVRAEEITLVLLILALWMVAIGLFVQRWGKIRMLEPYQPDYKHINEPSLSLNTMTSPTHGHASSAVAQRQRASITTCRLIPRKSSSLCFTPSMLQTDRRFSAWTLNIPQITTQTYKETSGKPKISARTTLTGSGVHAYHDILQSTLGVKAHSAENVREVTLVNCSSRSDEGIDMSRRNMDSNECLFEEESPTSQNTNGINYY